MQDAKGSTRDTQEKIRGTRKERGIDREKMGKIQEANTTNRQWARIKLGKGKTQTTQGGKGKGARGKGLEARRHGGR
jgi:hypothetical protein